MTVRASAPGKVILFGEHSVVHGRHAVAVALSSLRVHVSVERRSDDNNVRIELGDINEMWEGSLPFYGLEVPPSAPREDVLESTRRALPQGSSSALVAVAYLVGEIGTFGVTLVARSGGLPIGAGLGSSAALAVACSAAALAARLGPDPENLQLVNDWAFLAEVVQHGTPSGLDNAVSCFGGGTVARRILITNTGVPRKTKDLVDLVGRKFREMPGPVGKLFDAIDDIALDFVGACRKGEKLDPGHVSALIEMNHGILRVLGTSHDALENVARIAAPAPTKLTGAGGGGCAITLLHGMTDDEVDTLTASLGKEGYQCYRTALAGPGVQIFTSSS